MYKNWVYKIGFDKYFLRFWNIFSLRIPSKPFEFLLDKHYNPSTFYASMLTFLCPIRGNCFKTIIISVAFIRPINLVFPTKVITFLFDIQNTKQHSALEFDLIKNQIFFLCVSNQCVPQHWVGISVLN